MAVGWDGSWSNLAKVLHRCRLELGEDWVGDALDAIVLGLVLLNCPGEGDNDENKGLLGSVAASKGTTGSRGGTGGCRDWLSSALPRNKNESLSSPFPSSD